MRTFEFGAIGVAELSLLLSSDVMFFRIFAAVISAALVFASGPEKSANAIACPSAESSRLAAAE